MHSLAGGYDSPLSCQWRPSVLPRMQPTAAERGEGQAAVAVGRAGRRRQASAQEVQGRHIGPQRCSAVHPLAAIGCQLEGWAGQHGKVKRTRSSLCLLLSMPPSEDPYLPLTDSCRGARQEGRRHSSCAAQRIPLTRHPPPRRRRCHTADARVVCQERFQCLIVHQIFSNVELHA